MRDFEDSTLWRISAFERERTDPGQSGFTSLQRLLPFSLLARLRSVERITAPDDVMEVVGACMRQRDDVLLLLNHLDLVWPVTLFPMANLYHSPQPIIDTLHAGPRAVRVISVEPPGLRRPAAWPPWDAGFRPLAPLLWALALGVQGAVLLHDIGGRAAYRAGSDADVALPGALGPALQRLRQGCASLQDIAGWPGMDRQRAARLLNGLYLQGSLITLRTHPAARDSGGRDASLLRRSQPGR